MMTTLRGGVEIMFWIKADKSGNNFIFRGKPWHETGMIGNIELMGDCVAYLGEKPLKPGEGPFKMKIIRG